METSPAYSATTDSQPDESRFLGDALGMKRRFSLEEDLAEKERRVEEREKKIKTNHLRLEEEIRELEGWAKELEEREVRMEKIEKGKETFEAEARKWEEDRESILDGFRRSEKELMEREKTIEERKSRLDGVEGQLAKAVDVADEVEKRSMELKEMRRHIEAKDAKMSTTSKELEEKLRYLEMREAGMLEKEGEMDDYLRAIEIQEKDIKKLRAKLATAEEDHSTLEERYEKARQEAKKNTDIRDALRLVEEERDNLRTKVQDRRYTQDRERIHSLNEKIREAETELERRKAEEKRRLEDLSRLERFARDKDKELKRKARELEMLEREREEERKERERMKEEEKRRREEGEKSREEDSDGPTPTAQRLSSNSERWFQKGKALMKKANYKPAVLCFDQVLDEFPEEHNVLLHKARALYATNSHVQAAMVLDGLTSSPSQNNPDVWELKGLNLYRLHHEIDALEAFERAIELDRRPSALKLACRLLQKKGRLQRALEHIEDALQIDPDDRQAWKMKSSVLGELGLHREAGEALRNSAGRM